MKTTIGDYLLGELYRYGINDLFGVPGDYTLSFLDLVEDSKLINWVGCCNELDAAYAADGYARIKGMGAVSVTYGVGALSAINAVAGAYAERVPIVLISGAPAAQAVMNKLPMHHSLGQGVFDNFKEMYSKVTCVQEVLRGEDAQRQIDQALLTCFREKRPIYIEMAADIAKLEIDASRFQKPSIDYADSDNTTLQELALDMQQLLQNSKGQMVIGGHEATRYGLNDKLNHFIDKYSLPAMVLNMGKGAIDESSPHYMGLYFGEFSTDNVKQVAMASDVAIVVGGLFADSTTDFTHINDAMRFVEIHPNHCRIGKKIYNNIQMSDVLDTLLTLPFHSDVASNPYTPKTFEPTNAALTQKRLYELIEWYHKEGGILIGETGTPLYGTVAIRLKAKSRFVGQVLWGSIGYATGATLGNSVADKQNRSLLITGDGSFQLTAQSISTMLHNKLNTIIILINNNGYTIEKVIHGRTRKYNDINMWQYSKLPEVLTTNPDLALSFMVSTEQELFDALLRCDANPDKLALIEVKMGEFDVPWVLDVIAQTMQSQDKF